MTRLFNTSSAGNERHDLMSERLQLQDRMHPYGVVSARNGKVTFGDEA